MHDFLYSDAGIICGWVAGSIIGFAVAAAILAYRDRREDRARDKQ